jgi:dTDP-4-amino-4,6-dideoxygalactose transaminase
MDDLISNKIFLSPPHFQGNEMGYIKEILNTNKVTKENQYIKFEERILTFLEEDKLVALTNSGTSAIHLSLLLLKVKQGDEVLCQSMTFSASANPILYTNAKPVFIDSEKDTWNMCPIALEKAIKNSITKGKSPKAIIVVHLYGMPAKITAIYSIAQKYNIPLIEDAAEALGSTYKGQKCGTFGDFGILSFNENKIITAYGGGALICDNKIEKEKVIFLATQSRDKAPHYQHSEIGYNYKMSPICAALGFGQMKVLERHIELRRKNNQFYQELFKEVEGVAVFVEPKDDYFSNHWLSCIIIDEEKTGFTREDLRLALLKDNIESRPLWKPMHLQPVFKNCDYYGGNVSENLFNKGLCLPSGSNLSDIEKNRIKKSVLEFILKR